LRPGITIDHQEKIKARGKTESVLYAKKRRSAELAAEATLLKAFRKSFLANLGACEAAVAFDTHLAGAQQVGHCRDGFLGALCA
jgi:hypothetical protein